MGASAPWAEIFPTHLRGTGTGAAAGISRIASIAAPLIVPPLVTFGGAPLLFTLFSTAFLVAATTVFCCLNAAAESLTSRPPYTMSCPFWNTF